MLDQKKFQMIWGGENDEINDRLKEVMELLKYIPRGISTICDVGMGKGQISDYLAGKGYKVTGTGLEFASYGIMKDEWKKKGIDVVECMIDDMPFDSESFDAVLACHIFEHVGNMQKALKECHRVIKNGGWLLIFIPPYTDQILGGHINTGWNLGQLIYVLLLNGFDVKSGKFIHYGGNLCGFVKKTNAMLPPLRGDKGDIHILNKENLFPFKIIERNGINDAFEGSRIASVNWPDAKFFINHYRSVCKKKYSKKHRMVLCFCKLFIKLVGSKYAILIGKSIVSLSECEYNPTNVV